MSLCPHGYTAFWDCPTCEEPMGTKPTDTHEFGCTAYVGRPCICEQLRKERDEQKSPVRAGASGSVSSGAGESARELARLVHSDEPEELEDVCRGCGEPWISHMRTRADDYCGECKYADLEDR